jgi:peptidoglycan hydrolase-like protein with peptidoglycan-binding domain
MKKTLVGFLAAGLLVPAAAFADVKDWSSGGFSVAELISFSSSASYSAEQRVGALQEAVKQLVAQIAKIKASGSVTSSTTCFVPTFDLYMGRDDSQTNGEVKKLQLWLKSEGYFPDATGTGYYGEKTAAAVMKWQKAHGMDFVTLTSGVGNQTRAKMQEACMGIDGNLLQSISWKALVINPNAESYKANEQGITLYLLFKNGTERKYVIGNAYGCPAETAGKREVKDGKSLLGSLSCYYSLSGTQFIAYQQVDKLIVEKGVESAYDGSVSWSKVLEVTIAP